MKTGQLQIIPVLKASQHHASNISQPTRMAPTTLLGPPELKLPVTSPPPPPSQLKLVHKPASTPATAKIPASYGDPCLDLYFLVQPNYGASTPASNRKLNQLLPLAWFYNPLTTLKLICNLLDRHCATGKRCRELFYAAAFWLHLNHPKTLSQNLVPIVGLGEFGDILEVLLGIVEGQDVNAKKRRMRRRRYHKYDRATYYERFIQEKVGGEGCSKREGKIVMAKKALKMYKCDPDYQLLHERVSDLYAECLTSDIQNLKEYEQEQQQKDNANDPQNLLQLTPAAMWCPSIDSFFDRATLLTETIARKVFPREECTKGVGVEEKEEEEADYPSRVQERLMNDVLEPLRKLVKKGYDNDYRRRRWPAVVNILKKYWEDVKAGVESKIEAGAMLPHEIIRFVIDCRFGELAQTQWKAMMEEIYLNQGKFKNCLAVCDVSGRMGGHPMNVSLGLGLLMSEMSEEPWKGKVITFSRNPQLRFIEGDDLKSKCVFMRRLDNQDWDGDVDLQKVFDLILDVAVKGNLKPDQMIKKLFVFTCEQDFDDACAGKWKTDYKVIQSKFKEQGYENVVPRVVFWDLNDDLFIPEAHSTKQGVATLTGFSRKLFRCFLENDGEVCPDDIMEIAISDGHYQSLAVAD